MPSTEEWDLRDGHMGAMLYQNIKDPKAHGLDVTDMAHQMWVTLHAKFNRISEVLKGLALEKLHSAKLASGRGIPVHLDELARLRAEVTRVGGRISNVEMNSTISLPPLEFSGSIMNMQRITVTFELTNELRTYWDLVYKQEVETAASGVANALAANVGRITCMNRPVTAHTKEHCWARGGRREGQAPRWWMALAGMAPCQQLIDAAKATRAAR
ncbi:hypothetical protein B0H17DRAFT_1216601 [Mycena rosella]|uniref:Uncharacterized protein n=1 Tax=Mycena rosella TaxID=1033263 RepID=A0AAD7C6G8_MYCRO|nr:hypothetical protein B0H17DRAFT_1216601 [Mycena rosella]